MTASMPMTGWPLHPVVYEINTWVSLNDLARETSHPVSLGSVPQAELERLADYGFEAIWLMGVWQRSPRGREIAQAVPYLQLEYHRVLPDCTAMDVVGSPHAIHQYHVDPTLGGEEALAALRKRLWHLDQRLVLDFVPNHLAIGHPWLVEHPERLMQGSPED